MTLSNGLATNAAAVLALTAGARYPQLVGDALIDRAGRAVPGLIPIGIPVLAAAATELRSALDRGQCRRR